MYIHESLTWVKRIVLTKNISEMRVLWFSRHDMSDAQKALFINDEVTKVNGSPANVHVPFKGNVNNSKEEVELSPLKDMVKDYDVIAIVLPIHLEQQVLGIAGNRPVIKAMTKRELIKVEGEEDKVAFVFDGWKRIVKIEVVLEDFIR